MDERKYQDAVDGDIYFNPVFGDLWIVENGKFVKINDGYDIPLDEPEHFIKVGHAEWPKIRNSYGNFKLTAKVTNVSSNVTEVE